jgi:hypothetical protein
MPLYHKGHSPHQDDIQGDDEDYKLRPEAATDKLERSQREVPEGTP